jgi:hypothetical protein
MTWSWRSPCTGTSRRPTWTCGRARSSCRKRTRLEGERENGKLSEEEIAAGLADGSLIAVRAAAVVGGVRLDGRVCR